MPYDDAWFVLASYLLPATGPGKLQPLFRYQGAHKSIQNAPDDNFSIVEGYVNYVMKDYFAKLALGYQHTDMGKGASGARVAGNAIQFGFQIQQ